jgi:hypothetical protein
MFSTKNDGNESDQEVEVKTKKRGRPKKTETAKTEKVTKRAKKVQELSFEEKARLLDEQLLQGEKTVDVE